ncbi:HDIG domain-containing protein, partial [Candidatus Sumerlaeota bacterium]|nr:HDIG domain-containing protein [Candidatus Sumerlaeota bacterium]
IELSSSTLAALSRSILGNRFLVESLAARCEELYENTLIVERSYPIDRETKIARIETTSGPLPPKQLKEIETHKTIVYPTGVEGELRRLLPKSLRTEAWVTTLLHLVQPNLVFQPVVTKKRLEQAQQSIKPVYARFNKGDTIISHGEIPTTQQARILTHYNARVRAYRVLHLGAYLALIAAMLLFVVLYARRYKPHLRFRTSTIVLIGIPLVVVLLVGRIGIVLLGSRYPEIGYLFPAAMLGMLGVILIGTEMAILQVLIGSVLIGLVTRMDYHCMVTALFGGMAAVSGMQRLRQRGQLFQTALYVALVNMLVIALLHLIEDPTRIYLNAAAWGVINGAFCYLLTTGMLPFFESVFGITTDLKLLELTAGHHPLIRELEEKAPGSYQHSLNVAKIAEAAADAIGANYLLVRAGAYFHDIGKIIKPRYFSENQISPEDRKAHEKLTPFLSCLIIRNHAKEGVELARRHGLPEQVIDFIPQHHGTALIMYFYYEAVRQYEESESTEPVRQSDFRYPGPKPQTVEAGIVMLADSVEAIATNRLNRPNIDTDDIRRLVIDAVQDKFSDGQFDECPLTLRQLHEIRESMVRTLLGRFHHRVDYPTAAVASVKKPARESVVAA